jgi:hypothetical protein
MRTPAELIDEGECDEMTLGQLAMLNEVHTRLEIRLVDDAYEVALEIVDRYAMEIYDDCED